MNDDQDHSRRTNV